MKLEVLGDEKTLFPDTAGLIEAAKILIKEGFIVLPYTNDDPIVAKKLVDIGCPAVMPLAAPIGSGLGIRNPYNLKIIMELVKVPIIVDAGVGTVSHEDARHGIRCRCGVDEYRNCRCRSHRHGRSHEVCGACGRLAYKAGRIPRRLYATAQAAPSKGCYSRMLKTSA